MKISVKNLLLLLLKYPVETQVNGTFYRTMDGKMAVVLMLPLPGEERVEGFTELDRQWLGTLGVKSS